MPENKPTPTTIEVFATKVDVIITVAFFAVTSIALITWTALAIPSTDEADITVSADTTTPAVIPDPPYRRSDGVIVAEDQQNPFPVAVMIDNVDGAVPQSGLESASVIYEALVEGSATRLMAVFAGGTADKIGPVRSARPYFLDWAIEYDALYGHVGGSPEAMAAIDGLGMKDFSQFSNGQYFWRSTDRAAPHNVYTSSELIVRALRDKGYADIVPTYESWLFGDEAPLEERPTAMETLTLKFANAISRTMLFVYDRATNSYLRYQAEVPHIDAETGNQLAVKNVAVVVIPPIVAVGEKGRLTLDTHGTGPLTFYKDGEQIVGTWEKIGTSDRLHFRDADGNAIRLNRGTTWVEIIPEDRDVLYDVTASGG